MKYIKRLNKTLLITTFILPSILLFAFDLYLFELPEIFEGANKVGKIVYGLLFSLVSAYIFYFATVFIPEVKRNSSVNLGLKPMLGDMVTHVDKLVKRISKESNMEISRKSTLKDIETALAGISINSNPPVINETERTLTGNWLSLFVDHIYSMERVIDMITKRYSTTMEPNIISILHEIEVSSFSQIVLEMKDLPTSGNLKGYSSNIQSYFEIINRLEAVKNKL